MARLPNPGSDSGTWGSILNDFLAQAHTSDGSLKSSVIGATQIQSGSITNAKIADGAISEMKLDASTQAKLNASGGPIIASDITDSTATGRSVLTATNATAARSAIGAGTASTAADIGLGSVNNTSDANKPISTATQTALDGKAALVHTHTAAQISDSTTTGRSLLTASNASAAKSTLSLTKSDVGLGNVDNTSDLNKPISTAAQTALNSKADLVGGLVPTAQLPALAFNVAVTVANQAAMLALTTGQVQPGDIAVRTDGAGSFILTAADPSVLGNWTRLNSPTAPVTSVNSQTGTVVLGKNDVGLGNVDNTSDLNKPISTAAQTALNSKADLVGGLVPSSQLPAISLNTVVTVANQAAMLALTTGQVQPGDIAVRTDGAGSFILTATDPSVLGNWTLLNAPSDAVTSVNGQTGLVVLNKSDVGLGNVDNTSDATKNVATATALQTGRTIQTNLASTSSASFNGTANITPGITGTLPVGNGGTGATTLTGLIKGNGTSAFTAASAGTDYVTPTGSEVLSGKTLTNPTVNNYTEGVVANGTVTTACTFNLTNGTVHTVTLTASTACTFTMPTATAGKSFVVYLRQAAGGNGTATFTGVIWSAAGAPTITATGNRMDIISFHSDGTNWYGSYVQGYAP